ncbi:hypothetical protein B0H14DRAFT_3485122 [Mycena olivaceomarginata]|nr:hypothetical protein B0H14DRAFT_3485122 [Mycena olivaceomarginata]
MTGLGIITRLCIKAVLILFYSLSSSDAADTMIHLDCWQIVPDFWLSQANNIFSRLRIYSNFEDYVRLNDIGDEASSYNSGYTVGDDIITSAAVVDVPPLPSLRKEMLVLSGVIRTQLALISLIALLKMRRDELHLSAPLLGDKRIRTGPKVKSASRFDSPTLPEVLVFPGIVDDADIVARG